MRHAYSALLLGLSSLYFGGCCTLSPMSAGCPEREAADATAAIVEAWLRGQAGVGAGADVSTTAGVVGVFARVPTGPIRTEASVEIGMGSEGGYQPPEFVPGSSSLLGGGSSNSYWVFETYLHGQYPFQLGSDSPLIAYPLAGVRYYRFAYKDCDSSVQDCVFPAVALDLGAGLAYGRFSVEAFTGLFGDVPDASIRARYGFPIGGR